MRSGTAPCRDRRLRTGLQRLFTTRRGNSVVLFALSSVPVLALLSFGVDYTLARVTRGKLDLAADSAAVQATSAASDAYLAGVSDAMQIGIAAARARFTAQTAGEKSVEVSPLQVALSQNGGLFNATVSYSATMNTSIARVIGIDSLPISGQATASVSYSPPVDIQLLVDTSSSMTTAATAADRAKLERLTAGFKPTVKLPEHVAKNEACAFACHWSDTAPDFYQLAQKSHVALRIDLVRDAVAGLIHSVKALDTDNRFQLGLYTFNQNFSPVLPLTHSLTSAERAVSQIVPSVTDCSTRCADTSLTHALQGLATADAALPQAGVDGREAMPQRYLLIITDGIRNDEAAEPGAIAPTDCTIMKTLGFSVLVLYLPYPAMPTNGLYTQAIAPKVNTVVPALQACASSANYFFEAREAADINKQLQAMFRLVLRTSSRPMN
jgi:Flp pilus assembly protein TadG